jgi:hypothetical protein
MQGGKSVASREYQEGKNKVLQRDYVSSKVLDIDISLNLEKENHIGQTGVTKV